MSLFDYLRRNRKKSASVAKDRLQIILARERSDRDGPDYLQDMRRELLEVVSKYVAIDQDQIKVNLDREGDYEVLELNIVLPEEARRQAAAS